MKIELREKEQSSLEDFADEHGLIMEIHERTPADMGRRWSPMCRYYAGFKHCEVKGNGVLIGTFGDGETPENAMAAYAREISGKKLVYGAYTEDRREIDVPLLVRNENSQTPTETNFCPRCGKPIWYSPENSIHTCAPPDKTRQSSHWVGCWNTRGHQDCAIRRIEELEQALENAGPL